MAKKTYRKKPVVVQTISPPNTGLRERFAAILDAHCDNPLRNPLWVEAERAALTDALLQAVCAEEGHDYPTKITWYQTELTTKITGPCRVCGKGGL